MSVGCAFADGLLLERPLVHQRLRVRLEDVQGADTAPRVVGLQIPRDHVGT